MKNNSIAAELIPLVLVWVFGFWCGMQMTPPKPVEPPPSTLHAVWVEPGPEVLSDPKVIWF